ncbi:M50 family metallopeptidase [Paracoccus onubensis]|uniref:M50 family metallopeptidase n=1 Tax=Paracoccus onubensis TaxID=1675788 RepID=UPI00272FAF64|nr:M50 family metallopeptidase [Paracoccus onubensis]MDP0926814.1 M50 family metallopeptidase [Paracoccus onubensis]
MADIALAPAPQTVTSSCISLTKGVAKVKRRNTTVLISPEDGKSLRISKPAEALIPLLAEGTDRATLMQTLAERYPGTPRITRQLDRFLTQLREAGLLETDTLARPESPKNGRQVAKIAIFDMDPPANMIARAIRALPTGLAWGILAAMLGGAILAIILLAVGPRFPHPSDFVTGFHVAGALIYALVGVPLHEFSHAVACRLAGGKVGRAGIVAHGFVPGPYVETSGLYLVRSRWRRFAVPAAGPAVDLIAAGIGAAMILLATDPAGAIAHIGQTLMLVSLLFLVLNINPFMPSDGSHMVEALLDDELARKSALRLRGSPLSDRRDVAFYRAYASGYVQGLVCLMWFWWF